MLAKLGFYSNLLFSIDVKFGINSTIFKYKNKLQLVEKIINYVISNLDELFSILKGN